MCHFSGISFSFDGGPRLPEVHDGSESDRDLAGEPSGNGFSASGGFSALDDLAGRGISEQGRAFLSPAVDDGVFGRLLEGPAFLHDPNEAAFDELPARAIELREGKFLGRVTEGQDDPAIAFRRFELPEELDVEPDRIGEKRFEGRGI